MSEEISRKESEERRHSRRLSGFASPEYWTPERKEAQRQRVKKMNEEGRFGGRQPGAGRPKIKTVAQVISEEAQKDGQAIYKQLRDMALHHKAPSVKLGAMDRILAAEQSVQKNMRDDEKEITKLAGKDLDSALAAALEGFNIIPDIDLSDDDIEELEDQKEITDGD